LTSEVATEMIETAGPSERPLGTDPDTGYELVAKDGRYGPYVTQIIPELTEEQIQAHKDAQPDEYYKNGRKKPKKPPKKPKPKTGSLLKGMEIATMTLDDARKILSLPRSLGTAADGEEITAQNGRFGPYMRKGSDSRSLESEEQLFTITLAEAEEIYSKPKQRRGRGQAKPPIAEFGNDPSSGKKVVIHHSGGSRGALLDSQSAPWQWTGKTTDRRVWNRSVIGQESCYQRRPIWSIHLRWRHQRHGAARNAPRTGDRRPGL